MNRMLRSMSAVLFTPYIRGVGTTASQPRSLVSPLLAGL